MRDVKRLNPGARVVMKYDTVEVGGASFVYDHEEGRVVQSGYRTELTPRPEEELDDEGEADVSFKKDLEEKNELLKSLKRATDGLVKILEEKNSNPTN